MRLLTRTEVQRALSMREAIRIVERAFIELSTETAYIPLRTALPQAHHDGVTLTGLVAAEDGSWLEKRSGSDPQTLGEELAAIAVARASSAP